jgi:DNA-binding response OmpR family regulator
MPGKAQCCRGAGKSASDHDGVKGLQKIAPEMGRFIINRKYASQRVLSQVRKTRGTIKPDKNSNKNIFVSFNISADLTKKTRRNEIISVIRIWTMTTSVLILEDDLQLVRFFRLILSREGFEPIHCKAVALAKSLVHQLRFELALVDVVLGPEDNGLDFVRYARVARPEMGIMVISGKSTPLDRILGIQMGADDYLAKPLDMRELVVRAKQLVQRLRTHQPSKNEALVRFSGFILDKKRRSLCTSEGVPIVLTSREFDLLVCLSESGNRIMGRDVIARLVCGRTWSTQDRSVDVMVSGLRCKLRKFRPGETLIKSVRGQGYCFGSVVEPLRWS